MTSEADIPEEIFNQVQDYVFSKKLELYARLQNSDLRIAKPQIHSNSLDSREIREFNMDTSLRPVNIENLTRILEGIWSGELEHNNQKDFFCGTACCVAGWDVALNAPEQPENPEDRELWLDRCQTPAYENPWDWSRCNNNLTESEADLLFEESTTKFIHELTLKAFREGRRLQLKHSISFYSDDYNEAVEIKLRNEKDEKPLREFLNLPKNTSMVQIGTSWVVV